MTTTDTDVLRERFAEALHYGQGYDDWGVANDDERGEALALADEVLPIVEAEVRKAKAEALREAASAPIPRDALASQTRGWLRTRADQIETGDQR